VRGRRRSKKMTEIVASRFWIRFAAPFWAEFNWPTGWPPSRSGVSLPQTNVQQNKNDKQTISDSIKNISKLTYFQFFKYNFNSSIFNLFNPSFSKKTLACSCHVFHPSTFPFFNSKNDTYFLNHLIFTWKKILAILKPKNHFIVYLKFFLVLFFVIYFSK